MPNPLKWKLKLTAELAPGESMEFDVTEWERAEEVTLGSLGLSLEESKTILAEIQRQWWSRKWNVMVRRVAFAVTADGGCPTRATTSPRFVPRSAT